MSTDTLIAITVNGEVHDIPAGVVLTEALRHVGLDAGQPGIAVALGDTVVPRARWDETPVESGDALEVITATQGG